MLFIYIFHLLETNLVANVFLNKNWEEVFIAQPALYIWNNTMDCLTCFSVAVFCLIWLNQGLPKDTTGNIDKIKYFIEDNYEISKWIGLFAVTLPVSLSLKHTDMNHSHVLASVSLWWLITNTPYLSQFSYVIS